jgi:isoleucyl-tRNA synthetase
VRSVDPSASQSVHLCACPAVDEKLIDRVLSAEMALVRKAVSRGHSARKDAKLKVRQPLARLLYKGGQQQDWQVIERYQEIIKDEVNVKAIEPLADPDAIIQYKAKGLVSKLGPKYQKQAGVIKDHVADLSNDQIRQFMKNGTYRLESPAIGPVDIYLEDFEITTESKPGFSGKKEGEDVVALDTQLTPELAAEGDARELVHKVQGLRKDSGFAVSDRIAVIYQADGALAQAIGAHRKTIMDETLAAALESGTPQDGHRETAEINGKTITFSIQQVNP